MKSAAAQRVSLEDEQRAIAQAWADSEAASVELEQVATEARRRYEEAVKIADARRREVACFVGRNLPRKLYRTDKGIVVVSHLVDDRVTVELLQVI